MINSTENSKLFDPSYQSQFWSNLDPDLRVFLDDFEDKESWTYRYEEIPALFKDIASMLPKIAEMKIAPENKNIVEEMIPLLASMPFRLAITALSWLDRDLKKESDHGWGVVIFMETARISALNENNILTANARVVYDRIKIILMTRLAVKLFTNIKG